MSNRGRGRGGGGVKPNDRTSSPSSSASSRDSSLTRPTTSTTTQDPDRLMKQFTTTARPTPKFTPNLASSKKDKDKTDSTVNNSSTTLNHTQSTTNKRDNINGNRPNLSRGGGGSNFRGNNRGNYIQMEGIFQGNAQIPTSSTTSSSSRISSGKRDSSMSSERKPDLKSLRQSKKILVGDVDGLKYEIDEEYEPRQIPLAERRSVFDIKKDPDFTQKTKESITNNSEHLNSFIKLFSQQKLEPLTNPIVKDEPMEPTTTSTIPKTQEPLPDPSQLILMQFPDVLPCTRTSSSSTKPELVSLSDLPDGFLGKLQIYKSGKCRLKLNDDTYLDVDIGQPTSFLQNVMVTEMVPTSTTTTNSTNDQGTNNDMNKLVCLGDIKHKLVVSLDVDHVLQDTRQ